MRGISAVLLIASTSFFYIGMFLGIYKSTWLKLSMMIDTMYSTHWEKWLKLPQHMQSNKER